MAALPVAPCLALLLLAPFGFGQADESPPAETGAATEVEIRALANEGFLLRHGDQAVLVDAFVTEPYAGYDALPTDVAAALTAARAPFDGVDLALVSHVHADHFQAEPARRFLAASPDTVLVTSPQVIAELDDGEDPPPSLRPLLPAPGETKTVERVGITVELLHLSHGTGRFAAIQNLGHVITLGGVRILHLGDAAMNVDNFAPYRLEERDVDVALVPYWYFGSAAGRALLAGPLRARTTIACHVPASERDAVVEALRAEFPDVAVPDAPLETWRVAARVD